ncbi:hypothetical protein QJS10_CPA16g01581 [Acorus calamus]|uniref:J domain-containing protein n=1 Tax=Acorus calamus TaxID=4465 RepID=A0AAV9D290_ACOCL|nr:hypothetical protein QJS10_CPA16g01581 [Acorus calamus]
MGVALQLHPDKNKHSKAEIAFKLVSEAYECLSDKTKRKAFNADRKNYFCKEYIWGTRRGEASKSCSRRGKCGYPYNELRAEVQPGKSKAAVYGH